MHLASGPVSVNNMHLREENEMGKGSGTTLNWIALELSLSCGNNYTLCVLFQLSKFHELSGAGRVSFMIG